MGTAESRDGVPVGTGQRRRKPGALLNVGVLTISLLVSLGLGEALVRALRPQQLILKRPDIWRPVQGLGWTHRSGVRTLINTGEGTVHLYTDRDGYRTGAAGRVNGGTRILVLGDSFLEALQVEYEESIAGLLERRLSEWSGEPVSVRNTAVGGWSPEQYAYQARESMVEEDFDLALVFLYLGNDIVSRRTGPLPPRAPKEVHHLRFPRSLARRELVRALLYPVNDFLEVRSHLFVLLKNRASGLRMKLGMTAAYFPTALLRSEAASPRWTLTAQLCEEIAASARAREVPLLFVLIPAPIQIDRTAFDEYARGFDIDPATVDLDQPDRRLGEELTVRRLRFVDLLPAFQDASRRGEKLYGEVDKHLTRAGHEVAERAIEPAVRELLVGAASSSSRPQGG
ncbi:MAG: SGNH/GDSL hydrolase family protein [Gemmatimonadota bacterium]